MSYTTPSTARGSTYAPTAAIWNSEVVANLNHLRYSGARKYNNTIVANGSSAWLGLGSGNLIDWDTDGLSTSAAATQLRVPAGLGGLWAVDIRGVWRHPSTDYGYVGCRLGRNGSTSSTGVLAMKITTRNHSFARRTVSAVWVCSLSSGDYLAPGYYSETASSAAVDIGWREIHMHWLGPSTKSTSWPAVVHSSVGDRVTSTDWNNAAARTKWLAAKPVTHARRTAVLSISSGTWTDVDLTGSDVFDAYGMHSTGSNPSRVTVPRPGYYRIIGRTRWTAASHGEQGLRMAAKLNGDSAQRHDLDDDAPKQTQNRLDRRLMGSRCFWLNTNEYVELSVRIGSTARELKAADLIVQWQGDTVS